MGPPSRTISVPIYTGGMVTFDEYGNMHESIIFKELNAGGPDSPYTVYAPCGAAGSAMYDVDSKQYLLGPVEKVGQPTRPHCWLMYAPPIIIHGDYMSVKQGFQHINMVHRTSNFSMPLTTNAGLATLGSIG